MARWTKVQTPEDTISQQKVSEHTRNEQVLPKKALEQWAWENIPRDSISDCSKNPIKFSEGCFAIGKLARYGVCNSFRIQPLTLCSMDFDEQTNVMPLGWGVLISLSS